MNRVFIPKNGSHIDYETFKRDDAEIGDEAIVRKSNGKFVKAAFDYRRFSNDPPDWLIWLPEEFGTAFQAFIHYGLVEKHRHIKDRWIFASNTVRV